MSVGPVDASAATITGLLPIDTAILSGMLTSSAGTLSELRGTVMGSGTIPASGLLTIMYQMSVSRALTDRLCFGIALFDDGMLMSQSNVWLNVQPFRLYLPQFYKTGFYFP